MRGCSGGSRQSESRRAANPRREPPQLGLAGARIRGILWMRWQGCGAPGGAPGGEVARHSPRRRPAGSPAPSLPRRRVASISAVVSAPGSNSGAISVGSFMAARRYQQRPGQRVVAVAAPVAPWDRPACHAAGPADDPSFNRTGASVRSDSNTRPKISPSSLSLRQRRSDHHLVNMELHEPSPGKLAADKCEHYLGVKRKEP